MARGKAGWLAKWSRWIRTYPRQVIHENSTPARTGLGFALGSFIGIFPSFAVGTPIAFFLAGRLGWNRAAAVAGTFLMNPLTAPFFYSTSTWLGLSLLREDSGPAQVEGLFNNLRHFGLAFLVGNTLFALVAAGVLGLALFLLVRRHQSSPGVEIPLLLAPGRVDAGRPEQPAVVTIERTGLAREPAVDRSEATALPCASQRVPGPSSEMSAR